MNELTYVDDDDNDNNDWIDDGNRDKFVTLSHYILNATAIL